LAKKLDIAKYVDHESSIWLGINPGTDGGVKWFKPITTADPLAADTKAVMASAGIDRVYKAHSLRSATASALLDAGDSELDVMAHTRWSRFLRLQEVIRTHQSEGTVYSSNPGC
jgi:hypothetical protein